MVLVVLFATLIILAADARIQNSVEVNNEDNPLNLPKYPALAIQMSKEDYSYENRSPRIEYSHRGQFKFCVGRVVGRPVEENVWNPINQTTYQNYYFRYVKVDMTECKFNQFPKIQELFFDNDKKYYPDYDNYGYNISLPCKQTPINSLYFLIYNPQGRPDYKFKVRWTAYIDIGVFPSPIAPIDEHYEPDAFDPASYIYKFDD